MSDVTQILGAIERGDAAAANQLLPLVYQELRRLAAHKMSGQSADQTLQPTALVHEAWLRLTGDENRQWNGRTHFFAAAAEAMRCILVDNARRKKALRHGGNQHRVEMPELPAPAASGDEQLLAIDDAVEKFSKLDPQKAELVKLRYFVGMTIEETADALGISLATAKRHWAFARAWLTAEINSQT